MEKILLFGFNGENNSSKILLDNIEENNLIDKLYLENDFKTSEEQLIEKMKYYNYKTIYAFGQKPLK